MKAWRLIAAAAALCLFAHSNTALAAAENSQDASIQAKQGAFTRTQSAQTKSASAQRKRHSLSQRAKSRHAARRKSHKLAMHPKARHAANRHRSARAHVAIATGTYTSVEHDFSGIASFYWEGTHVATGARYNPDGLTAAHRTLPFGTRLKVTDLVSARSVVVTINDRGPFIAGRILDLSRGAAVALGMTERGVTRIKASVL